jgi:predicted metal-dependent hydrolase
MPNRFAPPQAQFRLPFELPDEPSAARPEMPPPTDPPVQGGDGNPTRLPAPTVALPDAGLSMAAPPPVRFVRHPRARRYVVRVLPDGSVRVTMPRRGSMRDAEAFLAKSRTWVARQREKLRARPPASARGLADGDLLLLRGVPTRVRIDRSGERARLVVGVLHAPLAAPPSGDLRPLVVRLLRAVAARELPIRLRELAARHQLAVSRVTVRDQRSRWGSCARSGNISLNWRLLQMPAEVADYVLVHELMHLREANHSQRFWRLVHQACPGHLEARRWLSRHGRTLL